MLAKSSTYWLNRRGKKRYLHLASYFSEKAFNFSPLYKMLTVGFYCRHSLSSWRSSPLFPVFIMKYCWILTSAFSCIYWHNNGFSSLVCWCDGLHQSTFKYWNTLQMAYIPVVNPSRSLCVILFMHCWFSLLIMCWDSLHVYSWEILVCSFTFL